jgi:hypothetical protein
MMEMHSEGIDWEAEIVRKPSLKQAFYAFSKSEK